MSFGKRTTAIILTAVMITGIFGIAGAVFGTEKVGRNARGNAGTVKQSTAAPKKVSRVKIVRTGFRSMKVEWEKSENAGGYEIQAVCKATKKEKAKVLKTRFVKGTSGRTFYKKLKPKNKYKFTVRAYRVVKGKKKFSKPVSTKYISPGFVKKEAITKTTATLRWAKLARAEKYQVVVMNTKGKELKTVKVKKQNGSGDVVNTAKIKKLKSGRKYKMKVVAGFPNNKLSKTHAVTVKTKSEYIWPVNGKILSGFGHRTGYGPHNHNGIDISAHMGKKIRAARDGKVVLARWYGGCGKTVQIRHSDGIVTLYGHLSRIRVHKGQKVAQGQVIGNAGKTGRARGPHLHYGVFKHGKLINPRPYLP